MNNEQFMDMIMINLPFQGATDAMLTLRPKALTWAEITFGLQPISEKVNMHALKAQYNSAQWRLYRKTVRVFIRKTKNAKNKTTFNYDRN